jgi:hypothetical protein
MNNQHKYEIQSIEGFEEWFYFANGVTGGDVILNLFEQDGDLTINMYAAPEKDKNGEVIDYENPNVSVHDHMVEIPSLAEPEDIFNILKSHNMEVKSFEAKLKKNKKENQNGNSI